MKDGFHQCLESRFNFGKVWALFSFCLQVLHFTISHIVNTDERSSADFYLRILLVTLLIIEIQNIWWVIVFFTFVSNWDNSLSQQLFCPLTLVPFPVLKVSEGSEVHFQPGNFSLRCQIQKETLPHGNEHLLNWAQKKYRAVTSFSELRTTQDIYIKVGEGVY